MKTDRKMVSKKEIQIYPIEPKKKPNSKHNIQNNIRIHGGLNIEWTHKTMENIEK